MKANVIIEASNTLDEVQAKISLMIHVESKGNLDAKECLHGFVAAVLKSDSIMQVFGLSAIDRETVVFPPAKDGNQEIGILVARKRSVQTEIPKPTFGTSSENIMLKLKVILD